MSSTERAEERRAVLLALAVVVLVVAALAATDLIRAALAPAGPGRIALVRSCFEEQRGSPVFAPTVGHPLGEASEGSLRTTVELNWLTFAIAESDEEAAELSRRAEAWPGTSAVELRGDIVLAWEQPPSPTQQQAAYDCSH